MLEVLLRPSSCEELSNLLACLRPPFEFACVLVKEFEVVWPLGEKFFAEVELVAVQNQELDLFVGLPKWSAGYVNFVQWITPKFVRSESDYEIYIVSYLNSHRP